MLPRFGNEKIYEATYRWVESIKRVRKFQSKVSVDQMIEVKYEDLVENPEPALTQICNFVGITYKSSMLDYWKLPTTIEHKYQSYHQNIGKPVFTSSIGKMEGTTNQRAANVCVFPYRILFKVKRLSG